MRFSCVLIVALLQSLPAVPAHACSTSVFRSRISPDQTYLLAVPQGRTTTVPYAEPPRHLGPVGSPDAEGAERTLRGWVVRVEQAVDPGAGSFPAKISEAILVPWGYGADCRPLPWQKDKDWLEPGRRSVFSAYLRPQSQWVNGLPVFDVFLAWHQPYPTGEFLQYEVRRSAPRDAPWLTADEYWSLIQALPTSSESANDPERAKEALQRWAQSHPALVGHFPASVILRRAYISVQ